MSSNGEKAEGGGETCDETPAGYLDFIDDRVGHEHQGSFPIWEHEIFKIGREPRSNTLHIQTSDLDNWVSRNHCEIYVIVYEPSVNHVYVRDRGSCNGTRVNGKMIGMGREISSGHLLRHGEVIGITPHWRFVFRQTQSPLAYNLTSLQVEECKLFEHRYTLTDRCLGQGAEAVVYLATDTATKKQLVCKLVNLDKINGKNDREIHRNFREADVLRQFHHPNILPYVDFISSPHSLYTFTELASGGDLMSFIYRHSVVAEGDAQIITRQVVRGLHYLHKMEILHRDLKPENILLAYSPKIAYHRVMLSDFGTCAVPRRSRMVTNVGTASYQAPEFQTKLLPQTPAVDIWSLGVVTLLLLTTGVEVDFGEMNRMDQKVLEVALQQSFSAKKLSPSINGQRFVKDCLRVSPSERINALEAECHDWLCVPDERMDFYRKLDARMIHEWEVQNQKKKSNPKPLELPSLIGSQSTPSRAVESVATGSAGTDEVDLVKMPPLGAPDILVTDEVGLETLPSPYDQVVQERSDFWKHSEGRIKANPMPAAKSTAAPDEFRKPISPASATAKPTEKPKDPPQTPWKKYKGRKPETQPRVKRRKTSQVKIPDTGRIPLAGLDRHLKPLPNHQPRGQVLEELRKTKSKFLGGAIPALSKRPLV